MLSEHKGNSLFTDVENVKVRTWNRAAVYFNIMGVHGGQAASEYIGDLDEIGRQQVKNLFGVIQKFGFEAVKKSVLKSV